MQEQGGGKSAIMDRKRVYVSGYPSYTQPQDLTHIFSRYGAVKVEKILNKHAILVFTEEDAAQEVIKNSDKIDIYGEFLTIKPFTGKLEPKPQKREFTMSKQREITLPPQKLVLSGDFHHQLDELLEAVRLSQEEVRELGRLYIDLQDALQPLWPGCVAMPFGSITTGLGVKGSDADCFVRLPGGVRSGDAVGRARRALSRAPRTFAELLAIPRASTPIVKFYHVPTGTNCDVTFKTPLGAQNSKLIAFLLHADPRLIPMAVAVKYWAKVHGFSGSGRLTNYALTMMIVFYLQQAPVSILPSVAWLQADPAKEVVVDHWNTGFLDRLELLPKSTNSSSISELLGGFFQYYSTFKFDQLVVSPVLGSPIAKDAFKDISNLPPEYERYKKNLENHLVSSMRFTTSMCIQDPFELCHNVASGVSTRLYEEIKAYFQFAAVQYDNEKLNDCRQFLKAILLSKPKISKPTLEFKVNISTFAIENIENSDWENVLRDELLKMFKELCKIELTELEKHENLERKRKKEKYEGLVTNSIWKRKQFKKFDIANELDFQEKQAQITEKIINMQTEKLNIQFYLILVFTAKNANASVKFKDGDAPIFQEFGRFFQQIMHSWYNSLLKQYMRPPQRKKKVVVDPKNNNNQTKKEEVNVNIATEVNPSDTDDTTTNTNDLRTKDETTATRDAAVTDETVEENGVETIDLAFLYQ